MELKITISHIKILDTIYYFNKLDLFPNVETILNILNGNKEYLDDLSIKCPTFETLLSISGRKLKSKIKMLNRYKYVDLIYSRNSEEPFLKLSNNGELFLIKYKEKHKLNYKKRRVISNKINFINSNDPSIIKL